MNKQKVTLIFCGLVASAFGQFNDRFASNQDMQNGNFG
jgi:hypothetical protein